MQKRQEYCYIRVKGWDKCSGTVNKYITFLNCYTTCKMIFAYQCKYSCTLNDIKSLTSTTLEKWKGTIN